MRSIIFFGWKMVTKRSNFLAILVFLAFLWPTAAYCDPGVRDTVRIDSIAVLEGQKAVLPVYFFNDEALGAVELVVRFDATYLVFDSFSTVGGRLEYIPPSTVFARDTLDLVDITIQDWSGWIPRGNGIMCYLFFTASPTAGGNMAVIDSAFYPPVSNTVFSDSVANTIFPEFRQGHITINNIPFACGDASGSGQVNALDITFIINYLYKHGPTPYPLNSADVNGTGSINALDATYLINFLYKNGSPLQCPA